MSKVYLLYKIYTLYIIKNKVCYSVTYKQLFLKNLLFDQTSKNRKYNLCNMNK